MQSIIVWFQKSPYPLQGGLLENSKGGALGGSLKPKFLKKSINHKWNFQRDGGFKQKTLHGRDVNMFWSEIHVCISHISRASPLY